MGDFKKRDFGGGNRGGGFGGNGGGGFGGGRSKFGRPGNHEFRQSQMFSATCAKCGKSCEVPFRPTGDRPVYCTYCFKSQGGPTGRENSFSNTPTHAPTRDFNSIPGAKPNSDNGLMYDLKKQIDSANAKLDKIIEAMKKNGDMVPFVAEKGAANGSSAEKIETKSEAKPVDLKASLKQAGVKSEGKTEMKSDKKAAKKKSSKKK